MKEPLLAVELEQKAVKLLAILDAKQKDGSSRIGYLAAVLLDYYGDGYDAAILEITRKGP